MVIPGSFGIAVGSPYMFRALVIRRVAASLG